MPVALTTRAMVSASALMIVPRLGAGGRQHLDVDRAKLLLDVGRLQRRAGLALDQLGDGVGHASRRGQHEIGAVLDLRIAGLGDRRHVRQKRRARRRCRGDRERAHPAVAHVLEQAARADEARLDLAADQIGHQQRVAAIRHRLRLEARHTCGRIPSSDGRGCRGRRARRRSARRSRAATNSLTECTGSDGCTTSNWLELVAIVMSRKSFSGSNGILLVERRIDGQRGAQHQQQRMAVGRGFGDRVAAGVAARAHPVLDDERLLQARRKLVAHRAAEQVERPAGRETAR